MDELITRHIPFINWRVLISKSYLNVSNPDSIPRFLKAGNYPILKIKIPDIYCFTVIGMQATAYQISNFYTCCFQTIITFSADSRHLFRHG
jgi:hypothetical protein